MIITEDMTVALKNNYMRFVGNMSAQEVDPAAMRDGGEKLQAKLDSLIEEESERGNGELKIFPDLLDLRVLADRNRFTTGIREVVSMAVALSDNAEALAKLGFTTMDSYAAFNVASAEVSQITKRVICRLYANLVQAIKTESVDDDLVIDLVLVAIEDLIQERMTFERFAEEHTLAMTEENESSIRVAYDERYRDWVSEEAERLLTKVLERPDANVLISPVGFEDIREKLYEICPAELNEWIAGLTADNLFSGEMFETLIQKNIDKSIVAEFSKIVDKFIRDNQAPQAVEIGYGQQVNPFYSINLASVLIHTVVLTSAELWTPGEELTQYGEYVVDLFREELEAITTVDYDYELTPFRLMSVVSSILPLIVSRSAIMRASSQDYILAQGAVTTAILAKIQQDNKPEGTEEETVNE